MSAKVLFWDIETAPIIAYVWGTYDQNVALNQIHTDWHVLAWSAKWKDDKKVMYMDQRSAKDITNDKKILEGLWRLLDEADVVVTQNGKKFDAKKVNARFIEHGMKPPSPYKHVDTLQLAKKQFGFTSNKLAYLSEKLCKTNKKSEHGQFPGFALWQECLKGNKKAWAEMEKYNKQDVLALEELYGKLAPWGAGFNPNTYTESLDKVCVCGGTTLIKRGFYYTDCGKFQKWCCVSCGNTTNDRINLLPPEKVKALKANQEIRREGRRGYTIPHEHLGCATCGGRNNVYRKTKLVGVGTQVHLRCTSCGTLTKGPLLPASEAALKVKLEREMTKQKRKTDCPYCRSKNSCVGVGVRENSRGKLKQRFRCKSCDSRHSRDISLKDLKKRSNERPSGPIPKKLSKGGKKHE